MLLYPPGHTSYYGARVATCSWRPSTILVPLSRRLSALLRFKVSSAVLVAVPAGSAAMAHSPLLSGVVDVPSLPVQINRAQLNRGRQTDPRVRAGAGCARARGARRDRYRAPPAPPRFPC